MSVYRDSTEILRFDLFDPPHMHRASEPKQPRHFYPTLPFAEIVELALSDLQASVQITAASLAWVRAELLAE